MKTLPYNKEDYSSPVYNTFAEMVAGIQTYGDRPALSWFTRQQEEKTLTYHQLTAQVQALRRSLPGLPVYQVAGNCDRYCTSPGMVQILRLELGGAVCYLCHGHQFRVKMGLLRLKLAAQEANARVALFGHTHRSFCQETDGLLLLNPGACGSEYGTYGVLEWKQGAVTGEIRPLSRENEEDIP